MRQPRFEGATLGWREERLAEAALDEADAWRDPTPIDAFERRFADAVEARQAVSFLGGRVALSAAIEALGLHPGDEVVVPAYTCVVVPNAFRFAGVQVRFADIEPETYGLDATALRQAVGPRTRAVLLHHLYGLVARDYDACVEVARDAGLAIIEDCAQATGARWRGRGVGAQGDIAIHSLEKTKVITTIFGGVATTSDDDLAQALQAIQDRAPWPDDAVTRQLLRTVRILRAKAQGRRADRTRTGDREAGWVSTTATEVAGGRPAGYGARLPAPLARLGLAQLDGLDAFNQRRRRRARRWDAWAGEAGLPPAHVVPGSTPVFLRYPVMAGPAAKQDLGWGRRLGVRPRVWLLGTEHPRPGVPNSFPAAQTAVAGCVNLPTLW